MKKYSKFFAVLLAVAMILPGMGQLAEAAEAPAVFVTVMDLNLRTKPVNNASPVVYVPMNKEVERVSISSDQKWFELKYDGKTGFALRGDVTSKANFESTDKPVIHDIPLKAPMGSDFKTVSNVNLRTGDRNDYRAIELLGRGTTVTRLGTTDNNWFRVKVGADEGYVYRGDVTSLDNFNSGSSDIHTLPLKEEANGNTYQTIIAQNLRTGDRDDYRAIKPLPRLEEVKHLGTTNNDWFLVEAKDGTRGYVYRGDVTLVVAPEVLAVTGVSAINSYDAKVTFNKEVKAATVLPKNFKVTDKDGNLLFVSKAELSKDKKDVTLSFFNKFADKAVYTVETSNIEDVDGNKMATSTDQFGFVAAKVAKVEFVKTTVPHNQDLKEVVKITDALGRDVTSEQKMNLEFTTSNANIVAIDGKAKAVNGTAIVVAKIKGTDVSVKAVITVADLKANTLVGFTIDKAADLPANTKEFKESKEIRTYTTMAGGDSLGLYFNDQYGESMPKQSTTEILNLTPNVAILNSDGTITPVSSGTAYMKVKVGDVEQTITIEVRNVGKVVAFTVEKNSVNLVTEGATEKVKLNFVDQYGTKITPVEGVTAKITDSTVASFGVNGSELTLSPIKEGSTVVTVTYKGKDVENKDIELTQTVNVVVAKAGALNDYAVEANQTKLNVYNDPATTTVNENKATIKVYPVDSNGRKLAALEADGGTTLVLLDKDGKELVNNASDQSVISIDDTTDVVTAEGAGTAKVAVKVGTYTVDTITFTVIDTTPGKPNTVVFTNNAIPNVSIPSANVKTELTKILSVKDITGMVLKTDGTGVIKKVDYEILVGNATNATVDVTTGDATVIDVSKPASVDIVVKNIKLYSDAGTTLLKEVKNLSEVIKITFDVNTEAVDQAKSAVEGATYTAVNQADINTQILAKAKVKSIIDALDLEGASYEIVEEDFTAAIAETADPAQAAVNGSYKFKVKITKGAATATTVEKTLVITATSL